MRLAFCFRGNASESGQTLECRTATARSSSQIAPDHRAWLQLLADRLGVLGSSSEHPGIKRGVADLSNVLGTATVFLEGVCQALEVPLHHPTVLHASAKQEAVDEVGPSHQLRRANLHETNGPADVGWPIPQFPGFLLLEDLVNPRLSDQQPFFW
eukprot:CAMPEP_0181456218 /NCGR_PEP_ID=MMETSP1110-20121109/31158_1 /TAXON_ID=174948 /ORGANISM="Symbiodinium sp., Strain CCMP421" /LENGTH=154 /DNA_ID=CAMNT_0023580623 /DNA_START=195 /DNA_END=656 /DNA_ORIENTATION=+